MESPDDALGASNSSGSVSINGAELVNTGAVVKGKRTKRQRNPSLPPVLALGAAADSSSASSAEAPPEVVTEEEEDMANCLILLAQGLPFDKPSAGAATATTTTEKFTSRRFAEAATTTNGKAGFYVYECKTCNKCFPSFQALGGHRTSHKKPKLAAAALPPEKLAVHDDMLQISMNSFSKAIASSAKPKVHECSICGSEFSSGQALGGHMRRHRPLSGIAAAAVEGQDQSKKEKSFLSLDLNLPAPAADEELQRPPSSPTLSLGKRPLLFPASALVVDCHY
ncbi:hypothetical protein Cni_G08787 [Canna indica]|uniref:C2H2-type domain-containing protein n=1 Tax=Canna indica TaxID=4628 RepID=A0AAQ3Q746_9LILI|nr:hypothetical protein Cni_G08787 [Canna indica]